MPVSASSWLCDLGDADFSREIPDIVLVRLSLRQISIGDLVQSMNPGLRGLLLMLVIVR